MLQALICIAYRIKIAFSCRAVVMTSHRAERFWASLLRAAASPAGQGSLISSVYLDNAQLELYGARLRRDEGAVALRMRVYWCVPSTPTM